MIKHLVSIIWNQRKSNAWIWVELLLVSVFLWYIVDYLLVIGITLTSPKGFDVQHAYYINIAEKGDKSEGYIPLDVKTTTSGDDMLVIADRIRTYPGVEAVSYSRASYPYVDGYRGRMIGSDTIHYVGARYRDVTPDYFKVFRIKTKEGNDMPVDSLNGDTRVITQHLETELFGAGSGAGKPIHYPNQHEEDYRTIAAVTEDIRNTEFEVADNCFYDILTPAIIAKVTPEDIYTYDLCIRVSPQADNGFAERFRREMDQQLSVGNIYLLDVRPIESFHADSVREDTNSLHTQLSVLFFLLLNIFLGIIGTFWVRTEARKGEMGLRIALGGTPRSLMTILVEEGIILLGLATVFSIVICFNLGVMDVVETERLAFTVLRFCSGTLITFALMALMITIGIWYPARQAMKIQPAEALHYE